LNQPSDYVTQLGRNHEEHTLAGMQFQEIAVAIFPFSSTAVKKGEDGLATSYF